MSELYFLRWKSIVSGPFPAEHIRAMLAEGEVTKHHLVSTDKELWLPLCETDWFSADCRADTILAGEIAISAEQREAPELPVRRFKLKEPAKTTIERQERWYYADGSEVLGPIDKDALRSLAFSGTINADSPVCREESEIWEKAGDIFPDFWASLSVVHDNEKNIFCWNCGFRNQDNSTECARCGKRLKLSTAPAKIPNYLVQSILVTLFCNLPLGIPAIVYAAQVNGKIQNGDFHGAMDASRKANIWIQCALGVSFLAVIVQIIVYFLVFAG